MISEVGSKIHQLSASTETLVIYLTWDLESHLYIILHSYEKIEQYSRRNCYINFSKPVYVVV